MHIESIVETITNNDHYRFEVTIEDAGNNVLEGAVVTMELTSPMGNPHKFSQVTDANGIVAYEAYGYQTGNYQIEVLYVHHDDHAYVSGSNNETIETAAVFA